MLHGLMVKARALIAEQDAEDCIETTLEDEKLGNIHVSDCEFFSISEAWDLDHPGG